MPHTDETLSITPKKLANFETIKNEIHRILKGGFLILYKIDYDHLEASSEVNRIYYKEKLLKLESSNQLMGLVSFLKGIPGLDVNCFEFINAGQPQIGIDGIFAAISVSLDNIPHEKNKSEIDYQFLYKCYWLIKEIKEKYIFNLARVNSLNANIIFEPTDTGGKWYLRLSKNIRKISAPSAEDITNQMMANRDYEFVKYVLDELKISYKKNKLEERKSNFLLIDIGLLQEKYFSNHGIFEEISSKLTDIKKNNNGSFDSFILRRVAKNYNKLISKHNTDEEDVALIQAKNYSEYHKKHIKQLLSVLTADQIDAIIGVFDSFHPKIDYPKISSQDRQKNFKAICAFWGQMTGEKKSSAFSQYWDGDQLACFHMDLQEAILKIRITAKDLIKFDVENLPVGKLKNKIAEEVEDYYSKHKCLDINNALSHDLFKVKLTQLFEGYKKNLISAIGYEIECLKNKDESNPPPKDHPFYKLKKEIENKKNLSGKEISEWYGTFRQLYQKNHEVEINKGELPALEVYKQYCEKVTAAIPSVKLVQNQTFSLTEGELPYKYARVIEVAKNNPNNTIADVMKVYHEQARQYLADRKTAKGKLEEYLAKEINSDYLNAGWELGRLAGPITGNAPQSNREKLIYIEIAADKKSFFIRNKSNCDVATSDQDQVQTQPPSQSWDLTWVNEKIQQAYGNGNLTEITIDGLKPILSEILDEARAANLITVNENDLKKREGFKEQLSEIKKFMLLNESNENIEHTVGNVSTLNNKLSKWQDDIKKTACSTYSLSEKISSFFSATKSERNRLEMNREYMKAFKASIRKDR